MLPRQYSLEQNYPNPFNPATSIRFALPVSGNVLLKVYDILGREVTTLVNEVLSAGSYAIRLMRRDLPAVSIFITLKRVILPCRKK